MHSKAKSRTENCAPSTNASGYSIVENVRTLASRFGAVNIFKAYLQLPDRSSPKQSTLRSELQSCGLSLTGRSATLFPVLSRLLLTLDCPHSGKNSVDLMMIGKPHPPRMKSRRSPHILLSGYHGVYQGHSTSSHHHPHLWRP